MNKTTKRKPTVSPEKATVWKGKRKEKAQQLVLHHVMQARPLTWIVKNVKGAPTRRETIYDWIVDKNSDFGELFRHAKIRATEIYLEEMMELVQDTILHAKDNQISNQGVQAVRLKIDTLKWYVGKLAPRLYGTQRDLEADQKLDEIKELVIQMK